MNPSTYAQVETLSTESLEALDTPASTEAIRELASVELAYVGGGTGMVSFS